MDPNELLVKNYMDLMWGEFHEASKHLQVAPLILAFAVIEASAKLSAPEDVKGTKGRFMWWTEPFLRNKNGEPYPASDLYGARCGLFHEYGAESDLSRNGKCRVIAWTSGGDDRHHGKAGPTMIILSKEAFTEDLYNAGIAMIDKLEQDSAMSERFAKRLPSIFGASFIGDTNVR